MPARISGVTGHLPPRYVTSAATEAKLTRRSNGFRPPAGIIERASGIRGRHVAPAGWHASDLAATAAAKALADVGLGILDIDLLIFASASQDLVEPATAHIVADLLGARCPVFDVKNACNSMLNAVQVGHALVQCGQYRHVLICSGETPSRAVRWAVSGLPQFATSFAGYTLSDCGAALVISGDLPGATLIAQGHHADSTAWRAGTLPGGGSRFPRDLERSYFELDGSRLREAFESIDPRVVHDVLEAAEVRWGQVGLVAVHQVTVPYLTSFLHRCGIARDLVELTVDEHGNCASASLPLQLHLAATAGRIGPGDVVVLVGLAGGISVSTMVLRW